MRTIKEQKQTSLLQTPNFKALSTPIKGTPIGPIPVPSLRKSSTRRLSIPYNPSPAQKKSTAKTNNSEEEEEENRPPPNNSSSSILHTPALRKMKQAEVNLPKSPFMKKKREKEKSSSKQQGGRRSQKKRKYSDEESTEEEEEEKKVKPTNKKRNGEVNTIKPRKKYTRTKSKY
jgi:hypothetical protein